MAAGRIPKPGTELGPCAEPCEHTDCAEYRSMASLTCRFCGQPIGFDGRYYRDPERTDPNDWSKLVHADCLEDDADKRQAAASGR